MVQSLGRPSSGSFGGSSTVARVTVEFRGSHPHDKPGALAASTLIWVAWLAAFGVLEMLALVWKGCPWEPLSNWTWRLEDFSPVLPWLLLAGLLAVFAAFEREILGERVRAGLAHARQNGKRLGRPATAALHADRVRKLRRSGLSKSEIARRLKIGRTSVRRILTSQKG